MCGRYALYGPHSRKRERFGVDADEWPDRYNIAPSQTAPLVRMHEGARQFVDAT